MWTLQQVWSRAEIARFDLVITNYALLRRDAADWRETKLRAVILDHFDMSLGAGLGKVKGRIFRIGHLGDFNDLMLMGTLAGVEMGLALAKVPSRAGGVAAAMAYLTETA